MKKILLFALAIGLTFAVSAQTPKHVVTLAGNTAKLNAVQIDEPIAPSTLVKNVVRRPVTTSNAKFFTISIDSLGQASNPLSLSNGGRTALWVDPNINSVMFTHRQYSPSGTISYDFSKNGGNTFTKNLVTFHTVYNGARYPQGLIYNPSGNTNPNNAYAVTFSALRDGSNRDIPTSSDWGGYALSTQAFGVATPNNEDTIRTHGAYKQAIPKAMHINPVSGKVWVVEPALTHALNNGYTDSLIISQGVFNSTTHKIVYTQSLLYAPVSVMNTGKNAIVSDTKIAFAPDGLTGWISLISHNDFTMVPDSCYYPIFYKTTDGGATWTGPFNVDLSLISTVKNFISDADLAVLIGHPPVTGTRDSLLFTTGFNADLAVDANGNPYLAVDISIGVGNWSIATRPGSFGMFAVYSSNGGTTWDAKFLSYTETFRGTFGTSTNQIFEDNRPQISTNWTGTKMFVSWLDTDTLLFGSTDGNFYPDIHFRGIDCASGNTTMAMDVTAGTFGDGTAYMGTAPYYVFDNGSSYEIPFVFQEFDLSDITTIAQFFYVKGFTVTDADFSITTGTNELNNSLSISLFPNPATTTITIQLPNTSTIQILNIQGQVIKTVTTSEKETTIDVSGLASGVYIIKVLNEEGMGVRKFVKE